MEGSSETGDGFLVDEEGPFGEGFEDEDAEADEEDETEGEAGGVEAIEEVPTRDFKERTLKARACSAITFALYSFFF